MNNLKLVIILLFFILSACTKTIQSNGLSEKKIENFDIKIGETSKKNLITNFGPPIFQSVFTNNVIYYVSHITSYKTFDKRKTEKISVLEITLDNKNIVQKLRKYSNKDSFDIEISKKQDDKDINMQSFWKDIINALRRTNTEN